MRERFVGLILAGGVYPALEDRSGRLIGCPTIVMTSGIELPGTCPLLVDHDVDSVVGKCDWFEFSFADLGVRVRGEVAPRFAAACPGPRGGFGLSPYVVIEARETIPANGHAWVDGREIFAGPFSPLTVITRGRLRDVSLTSRPANAKCYGRLLVPSDPPHLRCAAAGPGATPERMRIRASGGCGGLATIRAAGRPGEGGSPGTFSGLAYSGGPMKPEGWEHNVVIDLAGVKLRSPQPPALRQHDQKHVVGHMTRVKSDSTGIHVEGVFSGPQAEVDEVVGPAKRGFPWQLSVGADPKRTRFVPAGETAKVNGRTVEGPVTVSEETEIGEVSFVAVGADAHTSVTVAAQAARWKGVSSMWQLAIKAGLVALLSGKPAKVKAALKGLLRAGKDKSAPPGVGHYSDDEIDTMSSAHAKAALRRCMKAAGEDVDDVDAEGVDADDDQEDDQEGGEGDEGRRADASGRRPRIRGRFDPTGNGYRMGPYPY